MLLTDIADMAMDCAHHCGERPRRVLASELGVYLPMRAGALGMRLHQGRHVRRKRSAIGPRRQLLQPDHGSDHPAAARARGREATNKSQASQ